MATDFIRNGWYAVAWSAEIGSALVERYLLGNAVVLFRSPEGTLRAMEGTCPHRSYPLALGRLAGDTIVCGYHGIVFGGDGTCRAVPGDQRAPAAMNLHVFPLVERGGLVWLWAGTPEFADESLVPEHWLGDPAWRAVTGSKVVECHASLLIENVMDLTHETYLHASTIGQTAIAETPLDVQVTERGVRASRVMRNVPPPPMFANLGLRGNIDRGQIAEYCAPGLVITHVSATPVDGDGPTLRWKALHIVTPESATRSRYQWAQVRDFARDDASVDDFFRRATEHIFDEDTAALEAQFRRMHAEERPRPQLSLIADEAALAARKLTRAIVREETRSRDGATLPNDAAAVLN
jgi:vanillate O-demethylase monooxygenase subunit